MLHVSKGHLQPPQGHSIVFLQFYGRRGEEAEDRSLLDLSSELLEGGTGYRGQPHHVDVSFSGGRFHV